MRSLSRSSPARTLALVVLGGLALASCRHPEAHWTEERAPARAARSAASDAPDILVVLVDALRPDHLGCYGYARPTSPFLDRWSMNATRFDAAYTEATHTRMSIASLFTGCRPTVHRIRNVDLETDPRGPGRRMTDALSDRFTTLAESLSETGYETWGFSSNPHISSEFGFTQGFARWWQTKTRDGSESIRKLLETWRARDSGDRARPLFVYLHLMSVHSPYHPPAPYDGMFAGTSGRVVYTNGPAQITPEDLSATIAQYDGGVRHTDALLETLVTQWEEARGEVGNGRARVVVIVSDHGEELHEHGGLGHGMTVFGELARITLLVKAPELPTGVFPEPVTTLDLHRFLLDLAHASVPPEAQGRPRVRWSRPDDSDPVVYTESRTGWASYRWKSRTLVFPLSDPDGATFFDRSVDPEEKIPRREAAAVAELRARIDPYLARDAALARRLDTPARTAFREETEEALKSLGYLAGK